MALDMPMDLGGTARTSWSAPVAEERRTRRITELGQLEREAVRVYEWLLAEDGLGGRDGDGVLAKTLRRVEADHAVAIELLRDRLGPAAVLPLDPSGLDIPRRDAAPRRRGVDLLTLVEMCRLESRWTISYADALLDASMDAGDRELIVSVLLPRQRAHAPLLERLLPLA